MPDKYVDAYVVPVPKSKVDEYRAFTKTISDFVKKHGALEYVDCIADDVKPGKQTSFPQAVQLGDDEIVMLSWAVYRSREDRDRAMKAMMEEPSFKDMAGTMPWTESACSWAVSRFYRLYELTSLASRWDSARQG